MTPTTENTLLELAGAELERQKARIAELKAQLLDLRQREHAAVHNAALEDAAQVLLNGRFLHDQAPGALLAREAVKAIRALKSTATPTTAERIAAFERAMARDGEIRKLHADPPGSRMSCEIRPPHADVRHVPTCPHALRKIGLCSCAPLSCAFQLEQALAEVERLRGVERSLRGALEGLADFDPEDAEDEGRDDGWCWCGGSEVHEEQCDAARLALSPVAVGGG